MRRFMAVVVSSAFKNSLNKDKAVRLRPEPPCTGVSGPSGARNRKTISKKVLWGASRKVPKTARQSQKKSQNRDLWIFSDTETAENRPP